MLMCGRPISGLRMVQCFLMSISLSVFTEIATSLSDVRFPMLGDHNVQNCLAAIGVALEMNIDAAQIKKALAAFGGVGRRFEAKGISNGVTIIDDYGHHPCRNYSRAKSWQDALRQ